MFWFYLSVGGNVALVVIIFSLFRSFHNVFNESLQKQFELKKQIILQERMLIAEKMRTATAIAAPTPQPFDSKTMSLISLAVNNPNENEARSAAMQVCKRLKKTL